MAATRTHAGALATGVPAPAADSKQVRKERVLVALTRLNDKDTQRAAVDELFSVVRVRGLASARRFCCVREPRGGCMPRHERNGSQVGPGFGRRIWTRAPSLPWSAASAALAPTRSPSRARWGGRRCIARGSVSCRSSRDRRAARAGVHPCPGASRERRVGALAAGAAAAQQQDTCAGPKGHAGGWPTPGSEPPLLLIRGLANRPIPTALSLLHIGRCAAWLHHRPAHPCADGAQAAERSLPPPATRPPSHPPTHPRKDADTGVRDACTDALGSVAQGMYRLAGGPLPGSLSHPVLRLVFDCLSEQKKECQAAAGQALLQVSSCCWLPASPLAPKSHVQHVLRRRAAPPLAGPSASQPADAASGLAALPAASPPSPPAPD
jgi:hypothetical protein